MFKKKSAKSNRHKATHKLKSSSHLPTALVAGAAGFIGSHLCDALIHQNCLVYGIDNWTTGKKQNIKHLLNQKNFVFYEHDLNKPFTSTLPQVDYIFHLAGIEAYLNGLDVSLETLLVNSLGTRELLEIAHKNHAKFLLASTIDIFAGYLSSSDLTHYFGNNKSQQEAYSHHEAKRFSEALTFEYLNRHHLSARIVRLGQVYGPRMDLSTGNDLAKLFSAAKLGKNLQVPGNGLKPLYPTFIADVVYGLTKAMFSQSSSGDIYTLINPEKITLLNFAYKLKSLAPNKDANIEFVSGKDSLGPATLSDQALASQKNLGWHPNFDLEEGILTTLNWLKTGKDPLLKPAQDQPPTQVETFSATDLGLIPAQIPITKSDKPIKPDKKKLKITPPKFKIPKFKSLNLKTPKLKSIKLPLTSSRTKTIAIVILFFLLWLLGPVILMSGHIYYGVSALNKTIQLEDFSQLSQIEKLTTRANRSFVSARSLLRRTQPKAKIIGLNNLTINLDRLLFIGSELSKGAKHLAQAGQSGTLLSGIIFHHKDGNIDEAIKRIKINLDQAYSEFSFVESELQTGKQLKLDLTTPLNQKLQKLTSDLPKLRQKVNQARIMLPLIPGLIAQDSKKTYLLLLQNSSEIRPTGGFIGSYGLLTFEQGKLLDFTVEDIYAADGQLQGYIAPPKPIEKYFGSNTWYFRDSNWDPDFTISAQRAEWFLNKTTSRKVDGVIAVNLPAVKEFLKVTGPIKLVDFNEEVTADNLFDRAEYRSEIDFFPGSTQKKDFLGALARELYNSAKAASASELLKFSEAIEISLAQKQLLVYLHDLNSQKILLEQNWAGAFFQPFLPQATSDYTYLVEANLGINKANYFLKRTLQHQLTILKTKDLLATSTIVYDNQSPADAWPGGVYRSYLRDYLPAGSNLISVKVGDSKLDLDNDVDTAIVADKLEIGFSITVPVKNSLEVEITYRLPDKLDLTSGSTRLAIVIPKQPGIINDPIEVIVNHPTFLTVTNTNPQALTSPQVITFQSDMTLDRVFTIDFIER